MSVTVPAGLIPAGGRRRTSVAHGETRMIVEYMSFGPYAEYLMVRLLAAGGVQEPRPGTVRLDSEASRSAALGILCEAAAGGWMVEVLDSDDEPATGAGDLIVLRSADGEQIAGDTVNGRTMNLDGGFLRLDLRKVEQVHVF